MEEKDLQQRENVETESRAKTFFKHLGLYIVALGLAALTVIVLNF